MANTYDNNGNTIQSGVNSFAYDSEDHLMSMNGGTVTLLYDGDGNRVAKTVSGVTTRYLVDDLNPTGLPQVVDELVGGSVERTYTYGLGRISENQFVSGTWTPSFYGQDGAGSVRQLTNAAGTVTDTYEYDAFGNEVNHTGTTPNNYLYRGEQYDPDLSLYYLRARYLNPATGRFLNVDPLAGEGQRRYEYAGADPVDGMDPTGNDAEEEYGFLSAMTPIPVPFPDQSWCQMVRGSPFASFLPGCNLPPPPCPKCFAQLKYRPVDVGGKTHAFWWVQDRTETKYVIDGGPALPAYLGFGFLVDWITPGDVSRRYAADNASEAGTWYDSGLGTGEICNQVDALMTAARTWPPTTFGIWYHPITGPNSNTFARYVGEQGDFHPTAPPGSQAWSRPLTTGPNPP